MPFVYHYLEHGVRPQCTAADVLFIAIDHCNERQSTAF